MAKQKLSPQTRIILRKELAAQIKAGIPRVKILKSLSGKYGISTEGLRWYYKNASGNGIPKKASPAGKGRRPTAKGSRKAYRKSAGSRGTAAKASQNGHALQLPGVLTEHTERELKRILEAKKLVPHLEAATRREQELRKTVKSLSRQLRAESTKAHQLKRQIRKLTRA